MPRFSECSPMGSRTEKIIKVKWKGLSRLINPINPPFDPQSQCPPPLNPHYMWAKVPIISFLPYILLWRELFSVSGKLDYGGGKGFGRLLNPHFPLVWILVDFNEFLHVSEIFAESLGMIGKWRLRARTCLLDWDLGGGGAPPCVNGWVSYFPVPRLI